jgi:hypothetical protein
MPIIAPAQRPLLEQLFEVLGILSARALPCLVSRCDKQACTDKNRPKCRACARFWIATVALLDTGWKRLKQMDIDGIRYDICISKRGPLFRAAWVCATCCEQGAWAPVSATADQASELAQICLRSHHCLVHQAPPRLK